MNGVHDMGGMHGMGPIRYVKSEPVFHAPWEGRVLAMVRAVQATGKIGGGLRPAIENITAAEYLRMSYYEKWFAALVERLVESGLVTRDEIENGRPAKRSAKAVPVLTEANAATYPTREVSARRNVPAAARFQSGQRVRAHNLHPVTHTRFATLRAREGGYDRA